VKNISLIRKKPSSCHAAGDLMHAMLDGGSGQRNTSRGSIDLGDRFHSIEDMLWRTRPGGL
jgi:hypothetical protein